MPEKLPLGVGSIESTSPTRSARHEVGTCVSDTRQTNRRRRVNQYDKRIVLHSNGEPVRAKSSHRPGCSPRSIYATDSRWDYSRRPQSHSAAPKSLIRRLAAASLSPACQRRKTHLTAQARERSIKLVRCAAATLKTTRRRTQFATRSLPVLGELLEGEVEETKYGTACLLLMFQLPKATAPSLAAGGVHPARPPPPPRLGGLRPRGGTAADRIGAMTARAERDGDLRAAAPYGGSGSGAGSSSQKKRLYIKTSAKVFPAPNMRAGYCQRHRMRQAAPAPRVCSAGWVMRQAAPPSTPISTVGASDGSGRHRAPGGAPRLAARHGGRRAGCASGKAAALCESARHAAVSKPKGTVCITPPVGAHLVA